MSRRSLPKRLWYDSLRVICRAAGVPLYRLRCEGRQWLPREGGALVLSNHQSHLDPILAGLACDRRLNYLARESLFHFGPLRWLINSLDAIPIDRDGMGMSGLKETLRRLKHEEMVLIFPEGTRTPDGEVAPLKPGFSALAKRAKVPLVPMAIEGAFEAWPRSKPFPGLGVIQVEIGRPIFPDEIRDSGDRELVAEVQRRIEECLATARRRRNRRCRYRSTGSAQLSSRRSVAPLHISCVE